MFDANMATTTACSGATDDLVERPPHPLFAARGPLESTFVESLSNRRNALARELFEAARRSNVSPSGGVSSNLKSPV